MRILQSLWLVGLTLLPLVARAGEDNWQQMSFRESDQLFANPGQGWMSQQRSPNHAARFPCSVVYIRFDWADAEPEEGQYNWKLIDDVISAGTGQGIAVAMRVMTANAHSRGYYSSPKWLFDLGGKGFEYRTGGGDPTSGGQAIPRIEPDYADPIYLAKHATFIAALGKRYDANPNIAFLDIGSYGIWGEWHTTHPAPVAVRKQIVDLYLTAFPKTPLVFMTDDVEVLGYALAHGTGMRRDGVGSPWHEQNWIGSKRYADVQGMADAWKRAPVVFEWFGDCHYLKSNDWSFDAAVNFMLDNHVSMINDNVGQVPPEAMPQLKKLARLAGYRFVLREMGCEKRVRRGAALAIKMKWANAGVGRLYQPYQLQLSLRSPAGQTALSTIVPADPRDWLPGDHEVAASIQIPADLEPDTYTLAVALTDPTKQHLPLNLAMDVPAKEGWYQVGETRVE